MINFKDCVFECRAYIGGCCPTKFVTLQMGCDGGKRKNFLITKRRKNKMQSQMKLNCVDSLSTKEKGNRVNPSTGGSRILKIRWSN